MTVPKTSVNEHNKTISRQNDIRMARQVFAMQSETRTKPLKNRTHKPFRLSVGAAYLRHVPTASFFRQGIHWTDVECWNSFKRLKMLQLPS